MTLQDENTYEPPVIDVVIDRQYGGAQAFDPTFDEPPVVLDENRSWPSDMAAFHTKMGVNAAVNRLDKETLLKWIDFRIKFLEEELDEIKDAFAFFESGVATVADAEEIVDGCIDLCVVAIGTLNGLGVDSNLAWDRVLDKNMQKEPGVNPNRPNEFGLPDMIKPEGWTSPRHDDNIGVLREFVLKEGS